MSSPRLWNRLGGRGLARIASLAAGLTALCSIASGYYNFVYFTSRNAPFTPIPVRFDLTALAGNTVSYFISDQPPVAMMPGDTYAGIVSQIRAAASEWNRVQTSSIRVTYGGIATIGAPQSTPGIDVVFDDNMPVGLLAQTRVTTPADVSFLAGGTSTFVPLQRSRVQLRSDLTAAVGSVKGQPSYSELFYTTLVHEFGHALGLQHSLVSGAMATYVTRATTKGSPLMADDRAAISMLYPATGYLASTGTISGRVTLGGNGVNLASVVALSAGGATNGSAISALTNPDGTYTINGIPPGQYYLYVHPLPPAQQGEAYPDNVVPPVDLAGNAFPATTGFVTQFYSTGAPGTRDWTQATQIGVTAGGATPNLNFGVQPSAGPAVYNLQTWAYQGPGGLVPVPSPYLVSGSRQYLVFTGNGLTVGATTQLTPGLSVGVIGAGAAARVEPATLAYYQQGFLYEVIDAAPVSAPAPIALVVNTNNDVYVLPAGVTITANPAPTVASVGGSTDPSGNATVNVAGTNLSAATEVLFDGAPASQVVLNADGTLTASAPAAPGSYQAFVEAVNPDGQSSAQALGSALPPVFTYTAPNGQTLAFNAVGPMPAGTLLAGTDQVVDISGFNALFVDGLTAVGFGSSDIQVRRTWVDKPGHLYADVTVSQQASPGLFTASIQSGLQLITLPGSVQIQTAVPGQVSLRAPVVNLLTNLAGIPGGGTAAIGVSGISPGASLAGWTLTIGGVRETPVLNPSGTQITAPVPFLPLGPQLIHLVPPGGDTIPPLAMQLDAAPPAIISINGPGGPADQNHPVGLGDLISVTVFNLGPDPSVPVSLSNVGVIVAGVPQTLSALLPLGQAGAYALQFTLSGITPSGPVQQEPVRVTVGTRQSGGFNLAVHN